MVLSESAAITIAPQLEDIYPPLNDRQKEIVTHGDGPLLVLAGPGSGKTRSLTLRAMNLLLLKKAEPEEIVFCTYTEKAAHEMQDRLFDLAKNVQYDKDISQMRIGTIHSICNGFISENLHRISTLGKGYETLDQLTQRLFIFGHMDEICKPSVSFFMNCWRTTPWKIAKKLQEFFDKITEELIDINSLVKKRDYFLNALGYSYRAYRDLLTDTNCVDFAHQQRIVYDLLINPQISHRIIKGIRYVLVDEYQDTNYIQEQILVQLASETKNICVVGDEDQSLYRFRGATVSNILEFRDCFPDYKRVVLTTNYRSQAAIIGLYNSWISSISWKDGERQFRYPKTILPGPQASNEPYPATLSISGKDVYDEAEQLAEFVCYLEEQEIIRDYSQVALLMYSVKKEKSDVYEQAFKRKGIQIFCPHAGLYFYREEVYLMVACFVYIFSYSDEEQIKFTKYVKESLSELAYLNQSNEMLDSVLQQLREEIVHLAEGRKSGKRLGDYFYRLLSIEPFVTFLKDENKMHNLVYFSKLLATFQRHYHYDDINHTNCQQLIAHLFNNFLCLLHQEGVNDYEDSNQPFPQGYVQILTIHQAKGLEFPVVLVGSLDRELEDSLKQDRRLHNSDKVLRPFYRRQKDEPTELIDVFDYMRLYYVAFSRAMNLLVLTANEVKKPNKRFNIVWQKSQPLAVFDSHKSANLRFPPKDWPMEKPRYSFTGHINLYETCPRQYEFFCEYSFEPSHLQETFFGLLVHETIELIHRMVLDGQLVTLTELKIQDLFDEVFLALSCRNLPIIDTSQREKAFEQVLNYFRQNQSEMRRVIKTEEDISVVKDRYILAGKIDLLLQGQDSLEILDFKTSKPSIDYPERLDLYARQLYTYAYALEKREGIRPERLLLYWTEEPHKEDALMAFPYEPEVVENTMVHFDTIVSKIEAKDFRVLIPPGRETCKKCDIRNLCIREHLIDPC